MFRSVVAIAFALACTAVQAHQLTVSGSDTVRLGSKVISHGDTRARVVDAGGEPSYVRKLYIDNEKTQPNGERWVYRTGQNKHTVIELGPDGYVRWVADVIGQVNIKEIGDR
ncbi:MAG: hypothetical protein BGP24_00315 [Lysobacterales bacterium 69-70]|nr:DUF2845 domain-containing protein [Xanthomonadaceae bacterium]ODU36243.1 MAG: hypothetical protein ABS97_02655 [Xanthomonadaceae bacterium SCN 69-320]ODV17944.1 MAG: hypothetical protein ABT27_15940 [Xanthomonadaceae bacterium SCN 69-25]OJY99299.1 MAG: hypothetical protein BGP24_00315 [Xanthomonadales bacterium 69-70]